MMMMAHGESLEHSITKSRIAEDGERPIEEDARKLVKAVAAGKITADESPGEGADRTGKITWPKLTFSCTTGAPKLKGHNLRGTD